MGVQVSSSAWLKSTRKTYFIRISRLFLLSEICPFLVTSGYLFGYLCYFFSPIREINHIFTVIILIQCTIQLTDNLFRTFSVITIIVISCSFILSLKTDHCIRIHFIKVSYIFPFCTFEIIIILYVLYFMLPFFNIFVIICLGFMPGCYLTLT